MRYALILSALFALAGSAAAAPPAAKKCDTCEACKCADGFCPTRCTVTIAAVKPKGDLDAANKSVAKGEKIVLCLGVPAIDGAYVCGSIKGYTDGVYDCWKQADGKHLMQIRTASSGTYCVNGTCYSPGTIQRGIVQPTYGNPFGSCPNGNCPKQGVRYR